ncbi:MAG TPA: hypothetical protein VFG55_04570 [Rhodanobacteraceae bacterium]|nr:hypothetical protein [Rhodanobacteraceae bacterium]
MLRAVSIPGLLLLAGCVSVPSVVYYHEDPGYYETTRADAYDDFGNGSDNELAEDTAAPVIDYEPDYLAYTAYYDVLWPVYSAYYDPFFAPNFYYGVTFFPGYYGYSGWGFPGWGFGAGFAYSPWWHSYWDNAYDWAWWYRCHPDYYARYRRYGSLHNQQAMIASFAGRARATHGYRDRAEVGYAATVRAIAPPAAARSIAARVHPSGRATVRPTTRGIALPSSRYAPATRAISADRKRGARAVAAYPVRNGYAPDRVHVDSIAGPRRSGPAEHRGTRTDPRVPMPSRRPIAATVPEGRAWRGTAAGPFHGAPARAMQPRAPAPSVGFDSVAPRAAAPRFDAPSPAAATPARAPVRPMESSHGRHRD